MSSNSRGNQLIRRGNLQISLTRDAYDYNDQLFTIELTELPQDVMTQDSENVADISGLSVDAPAETTYRYLAAAMFEAERLYKETKSVRHILDKVIAAGLAEISRKPARRGM